MSATVAGSSHSIHFGFAFHSLHIHLAVKYVRHPLYIEQKIEIEYETDARRVASDHVRSQLLTEHIKNITVFDGATSVRTNNFTCSFEKKHECFDDWSDRTAQSTQTIDPITMMEIRIGIER